MKLGNAGRAIVLLALGAATCLILGALPFLVLMGGIWDSDTDRTAYEAFLLAMPAVLLLILLWGAYFVALRILKARRH